MNKKNHKTGFSLIEVIIAFSILTITVVASTSLIANSIRANQDNILRVQAYFLAQEGLELARNQRDTNWLNNNKFTDNLIKTETENETLFPTQNPTTGQYSFTTTPTTTDNNQISFIRTITAQRISQDQTPTLPNNTEYKDGAEYILFEEFAQEISSTVSYGPSNATTTDRKSITLKTVLTNWKQ